MAALILTPKMVARFWSYVQRSATDECWPWLRTRTSNGYGRLTLRNQGWLAHRVAWTLTNGAIPKGVCVLHRCDNRLCCNPAHHFLGSYADNNADMRQKRRHAHGERQPISKLTESDVRAIRELRARGLKLFQIAEIFHIGVPNVSHICARKGWAHVP